MSSHPVTAREVIHRIQRHVGVPWRDTTVDTFKTGDPDAPVHGIAVTMTATLEVLRRAAATGHNLVITHEPTFYSHFDDTAELTREVDAVFAAKAGVLQEHHLIVWRFHDHWHYKRPDGVLTGMMQALGWARYQSAAHEHVFNLPATTLGELAAALQRQLGIQAPRVVGNADLPVSGVALSPGFAGFGTHRRLLQRDDVQVLVLGEAHEWETIAYAADAVTAGAHKALIILGHVPSEQGGMEACAQWLRGFVTEVPVEYIPTAEPFWVPIG